MLERVAEELLVFKAHIGDDAQFGSNDIGAIEPATKSCLDNSDIDVAPSEVVECHGGHQLKERRLDALNPALLVIGDPLHDETAAHHPAVDANALPEVHKVRRCEQPDLVAALLQAGGQQVCR